jgi:hypothetical protein
LPGISANVVDDCKKCTNKSEKHVCLQTDIRQEENEETKIVRECVSVSNVDEKNCAEKLCPGTGFTNISSIFLSFF